MKLTPAAFAGFAAAAVVTLVVAACGGISDKPAAAPPEPAQATEAVEPVPEPDPPPPAPEPEPEPPPPAPEPDPPPAVPEPEPEPPAEAEEFTTPTGITCSNPIPERNPNRPTFEAPFELALVEGATYTATLETACGTIVLEFDVENAPITSNNFIELARAGFYDGLTFHRAVGGFVIQGGDPNGNGTGGPGYSFQDELPTDGYALGDLAMANAGPNTNGSQFFIITGEDGTFLPNDFSKFGRVLEGLDVAQGIESLGDPSIDASLQPIYIYSVTIAQS